MRKKNNGPGKVYLVGAGPGDAELLTIKGSQCLATADAVVYDRLVNISMLDLAPSKAEKIYVGKAPHRHALSQEEINELLVDLGRSGKKVVRLKGGDPFVFGRGGEEALALRSAGIPFEIVPGVTSAVGVPAYAGIPVTHRGIASTVAFITGNEDPSKDSDNINWQGLAQAADTLVFLMGVANLDFIISQLLAFGRSPDTPVAIIRWGTRAEQETLVGTLADIKSKAQHAGITNPAVIVVGDVVSLRSSLAWLEAKPLFGLRFLITRPVHQASGLVKRLSELGAEVVPFPTVRIVPPDNWEAVDRTIQKIKDYHWAIFTSANGVQSFFRRLNEKQTDSRSLWGMKIAAIGPATAGSLQEHGILADWQPKEFIAEAVAEELGPFLRGKKVLLPRSDIARPFLVQDLRSRGADVDEVTVYRTEINNSDADNLRQMLAAGKIHAVTFTSSSTVNFLLEIVGGSFDEKLRNIKAFCIGPITAATAREAGLTVTGVATEYTQDGLVHAIVHYYTAGKGF